MPSIDELEKVRYHLNNMIISGNYSEEDLLKVSQELDVLVVRAMREKTGQVGSMLVEDESICEWDGLLDKLQIFEKMYQEMRIIDPVTKKVLELTEGELCGGEHACYDFWRNNTVCENCISMRAYNEDDTFFKIVSKEDKIYMVTAVPVVIKGKRLVVELFKETTDNLVFGDGQNGQDVRFFTMIKHMNKAAVKDPLTGVFNRRYINERLPVEIISASIHHIPLSVIFVDLDHFKNVNDTYGHLAGDMVLKQAVKLTASCIQKEKDWVARYGGEELLACLPGKDNVEATRIAERMRKDIEKEELQFEGKTIKITASFGVFTLDGNTDFFNMEDLMKQVDDKLYKAKKDGRNKVV